MRPGLLFRLGSRRALTCCWNSCLATGHWPPSSLLVGSRSDTPGSLSGLPRKGHEIASHGWWHRKVSQCSAAEFRKEVVESKAILQDVSGRPIYGHRAPSFSIGPGQEWAFGRFDRGRLYVRFQHLSSASGRLRIPRCGSRALHAQSPRRFDTRVASNNTRHGGHAASGGRRRIFPALALWAHPPGIL